MGRQLSDYKQLISLPDFIMRYGYVEAKRSTKRFRRFQVLDGNQNKLDVLIVFKTAKGEYAYMSFYGSSKKKDIIDFVQDRHSTDGKFFNLGLVRKLLDKYLDSPEYINPVDSRMSLDTARTSDLNLYIELQDCEPYFRREYLLQRGISAETIDRPEFFYTIKNKSYHDPASGRTFVNTAYLLRDAREVRGLVLKNLNADGSSYKRVFGDRGVGLVLSRVDEDKRYNHLYLFESFDDALSHFELNKEAVVQNKFIYASTAGALTHGQTDLIQQFLINEKGISHLHLCFDNDLAGHRFRVDLLANLVIPDRYDPLFDGKIIVHHNEGNGVVSIEIANDSKAFKDTQAILDGFIVDTNRRSQGLLCEGDAIGLGHTKNEHFHYFHVKLNSNIAQLWELTAELIVQLKYKNTLSIMNEVPVLGDFNEDLKASLGSHSDHKMTLEEDGDPEASGNRSDGMSA